MQKTLSVEENTTRVNTIRITDQSILGELRSYEKRYSDAIAEFIWNAFDAEANIVDINYEFPAIADGNGFGYPQLMVIDDGIGWDMGDASLVATFLDSKKRAHKQPYRSIPHGSKGVGRFTFCSFAKSATWRTCFEGSSYNLTIKKENISSYTLEPVEKLSEFVKGTSVTFEVNNDAINEAFFEIVLPKKLLEKFGWFLVLYPHKDIRINGTKLNLADFIEAELEGSLIIDGANIDYKLVQWKRSLTDKENSKVYFVDDRGHEVFKTPSGLNNKSDIFYHSAYVKSDQFAGYSPSIEDTEEQPQNQVNIFSSDSQAKLIRKTRSEVKDLLEGFRQPHIEAKSEEIIGQWAQDKIIPDVESYGVNVEQYSRLIKETFIIAPNLYLGVPDDHKRVIFNLLASLMGTSDRRLILTILEQVYNLTDDQKESLGALLERTTIENILNTIKEIDQRLQTIDDLDRLIHDPDIFKKTLEVKHLQQIVNQEFWIFGEEYRLVIDTEGSIKKAISKWAKEILGITDYDSEADSKKEMDLLISKKLEYQGEDRILNVVVELKRPSVKLSDKELGQLKRYRKELFKDPACTGKNIEWVFILVGRDYDDDIKRAIESAKSNGEEQKGLVEHVPSEHTKIYVRRWSEMINGELLPKHRYLQDKLRLEAKASGDHSSDAIVQNNLLGRGDETSI